MEPVQDKKEVVTEVTSIAAEEERTGEKINTPPTPEELVSKSGMSIIMNRQHLKGILPKLGKKALQRLLLASLDLPAEGVQVKLISNEEKLAFRLCQSTIRAMFTVMFYHTSEEIIKKHKEKEETETQSLKEEELCQTDKTETEAEITPNELTQSSQLDGSKKEKKESTSLQLPTESDKK